MMLFSLLVTFRLALAHGSDRSHQLMIEFGRAVRRPDQVVADAQYRPLDDDGLRAAIAALDGGVRAATGALVDCTEDLYPAATAAWSADARAAYGARYRQHLAAFRDALVEYRDACARQLELDARDRSTTELLIAKTGYLDLARRAHREL